MGYEERDELHSSKPVVQFYLGTADGHWYYCLIGRAIDAIGPFLTRTCAEQHASNGGFRVID